jgi:hypothetical protein
MENSLKSIIKWLKDLGLVVDKKKTDLYILRVGGRMVGVFRSTKTQSVAL